MKQHFCVFFVRMHQCTEVTQDWLVTTHREMAHVYYFLSFWDQPFIYRDSANPGFYHAVGDMMSLFAASPKHLAEMGLLKDYVDDNRELTTSYVLLFSWLC